MDQPESVTTTAHATMESKDKTKLRVFIKFLRILMVLIIATVIAGAFIKTRPRPKQKRVARLGPLVEVVEAQAAGVWPIAQIHLQDRPPPPRDA